MKKELYNEEDWLFEIKPKDNFFSLNLREVWQYRDLLMLFVNRDIVTVYKQTILGPLWYLIQPLFTSIIFTIIFNNVAGIQTGSIPPFLFNLAGVSIWNYFYYVFNGMELQLSSITLFFPLLVVLMGFLGLGLGMIISSLVTKYRDLSFLVGFGVQLLMYLSAVMYPMALLKEKLPSFGWLIEYNPLAYIVETSRYLLLKEGTISGFGN